MNTSFEVLKAYFDLVNVRDYDRSGPYRATAVGQFVPSPLPNLHVALNYLLELGLIPSSGLFLDAGCGDGRVVALTALVHGIPTLGVEYDDDLLERAEYHVARLKGMGLQGAPVVLAPGDFTDDDTYRRVGRRFEEIPTVFNYINNERALAAKVVQQSPPGTTFLLSGAFPVPGYQGLTLTRNLELAAVQGAAHGVVVRERPVTGDSCIELYATYLQVYRK